MKVAYRTMKEKQITLDENLSGRRIVDGLTLMTYRKRMHQESSYG